MKVENIKKLPTEFDFVSRVNPFGILYHAKEQCHNYSVTWSINESNHSTTYSKEEFRRCLLNDEFVPRDVSCEPETIREEDKEI